MGGVAHNSHKLFFFGFNYLHCSPYCHFESTSILYYLTGMNTQLWEMDGWTIFTNCCNWTIEFVPPVWKCLLWITIYQDVGRKSFAWLLTARCCIIWSMSKLLFGLDLVLFFSTWVLLYPAWIKDSILFNLD